MLKINQLLYKTCIILLLLIGSSFYSVSHAQIIDDYLQDEEYFYAATKQVNQFFRRFNSEEDERGQRIYEGNPLYHNTQQRQKYIAMLFDNQTSSISQDLKRKFIRSVTSPESNQLLQFHGGQWIAEVSATFTFQGKEEMATFFMKIEKEKLGSKWVFTRAYFNPFARLFNMDTTNRNFLHPMSHELDFMNLNKVFRDKNEVEDYTSQEYYPDQLSIFLYELKKGNLKFQTIRNVKFHFFQLDNWYFEISEFNRSGYNKGWLISNLAEVTEEDKEKLIKYIYFEK